MEEPLLHGCIHEMHLKTTLGYVSNVLKTNDLREVSNHIEEINHQADTLSNVVKPVITRYEKEGWRYEKKGLLDIAEKLRERYNPLLNDQVDDAISLLNNRINILKNGEKTKLESCLYAILDQLDILVDDAFGEGYNDNRTAIENRIADVEKIRQSALEAIQNLKQSYFKTGLNDKMNELTKRESSIIDRCAQPIRALQTHLAYLDHCNYVERSPETKCVVENLVDITSDNPIPVEKNVIDLCASNGTLEPRNPDTLEKPSVPLPKLKTDYELSKHALERFLLTLPNALSCPKLGVIRALQTELNEVTEDFSKCSKEYVQALDDKRQSNTAGTIDNKSFMLIEFDVYDASKSISARIVELENACDINRASPPNKTPEEPPPNGDVGCLPSVSKDVTRVSHTPRAVEHNFDSNTDSEIPHANSNDSMISNINSTQRITEVQTLLEPPDDVLNTIFKAGSEVQKLCASETDEKIQAQLTTSDLLSSNVEITRLVRRVTIKPEIIKTPFTKLVLAGSRRKVYPDVNYSRVLLRNKYQPLADLISDPILDDEVSDSECPKSVSGSNSDTESISNMSRSTSRTRKRRKKRRRSYELPLSQNEPQIPSAQNLSQQLPPVHKVSSVQKSPSERKQRSRSHESSFQSNKFAARRRIRNHIVRMNDLDVALYLCLHGSNEKVKTFFAECKPYLTLDADAFNFGKEEDPTKWIARSIYCNERCDVTLEKFIKLYYLKSDRPIYWARLLATHEPLSLKP